MGAFLQDPTEGNTHTHTHRHIFAIALEKSKDNPKDYDGWSLFPIMGLREECKERRKTFDSSNS